MAKAPGSRERSTVAAQQPEPPASAADVRWGLVVLGATLAYPLLESRFWSRALWGANALAFLPRAWWLVPLACALLFVPRCSRAIGERLERVSLPAHAAWPWVVGLAAAAIFWLVRERHLYWGDALPLSIDIPAGHRFHPDEPLTLWLQHAVWAMGGGRWSAVQAIAAASAVAGGVWVALHARGFARTSELSGGMALLATLAIASQGAAAIFHGHVENYAYVAVCFAAFAWAGVDYLEGRAQAWPAFAALLLAFAFHLLGALAFPAALLLVVHGLARRERRAEMLATLAGLVIVAGAAAWMVRGLYPGGSPFAQLSAGVVKVLRQPRDMQAGVFFSARHLADAWSHSVQMGPLSLVSVAALVAVRPIRDALGTASGRFLALAALTLYAPALLTGAGNLGAARNWDLFAAPAGVLPLFALRAMLALPPAARERLLFAALAASLAQAVPWTALNMSREATEARVAALPLGGGRSQAMLGTAALNAGDLPRAERWFLASLAEDSLNVNALSGLGVARARAGRIAEAEPPLTRVVLLKPETPQYHRDLATLYMQTGRWSAASAQWQAALPLEPHDRESWLGLAASLAQAGRRDSSVYALLAASEALPADPEITRALADACALWVASAGQEADREEFARAWALFESRFPDDDRVRAWRSRAEALLGH
ncbi:MAG TPA: tetratricopeptide repeat protein [Verrucomicrobiae bacterium]|nr:tetratricopeptide repeat protein [Verrucomicrobiae bacterium]